MRTDACNLRLSDAHTLTTPSKWTPPVPLTASSHFAMMGPYIDQMKSDLYRYEMKWLQEFLQAK